MPSSPAAGASGGALVYIFRIPEMTVGVRASAFFVDGSKVATMGYQGCVSVVVPPGHHEISQKWIGGAMLGGDFHRALTVEADMAAGETYYVRFDTDVSSVQFNGAMLDWELGLVSADTGRSDVAVQHCTSVQLAPQAAHPPAGASGAR
jgi:hypothetical protein